MHSCILAFVQYFDRLHDFYLPPSLLDAGDTLVTRTQMVPALKELAPLPLIVIRAVLCISSFSSSLAAERMTYSVLVIDSLW